MTKLGTRERPRAAIYARISRDAEGEKLGVSRQIDDCRALAKSLGYEVVEEFIDNDISASTKSQKARPAYTEMLAAARADQIDAILAYSNSRLTRRPRELEDLIDLHDRHRTRIATVVSGNDDLSTADGRMVARIKGNVDTAEAERVAERTKRAKEQMATDGKYRGGRRPYGYEKGGLVINKAEADVVREATTAVLAGRTVNAVARELNERGMKTSTGAKWTQMSLRDVLLRPRNAGLIARGAAGHAGFEIGGRAQWPALVDEDTWRALFTKLTDPSRRTNKGSDTKWLGSFIYRCGIEGCGAVLRSAAFGGTTSRPNHKRKYHYRCTGSAHLMVLQEPTDDYVRGVVAELVRDPRVIAALSPKAPDMSAERERRTTLEGRLAGFERDYALGDITGGQLKKATEAVTAEIADIDARLAQAVQHSSASPIAGAADPGAAFLAAPIDVQRAVLATVLRVEVLPRPEALRGTSWRPDRLRLTPATAAE
ncbi:recombinase family protein [Agromyces silvae]|uniref:recombinase family protein n=1 Tax=Agromyces silvae TaxID=3388266 RepID=UPI00280A7E6A|nr:recombinase family protein [Agromyces protaetiae]